MAISQRAASACSSPLLRLTALPAWRSLPAVHDFSEPAHLALAPERLQGAVGSPPAAGSPPVPSSSQPAAAGPGGSERGAEAAGSQDATQCSPGAAAACSSQIIPDSPADQSPLLQLAARAAEGVPVDEGGGTQPQPQPSSPPAFSLLPLGGTQVVAISPPAPLEPPPEHAEHQLGGQQQPHEAPEQSKVEGAAAGAAAAALPAPVPVAEQPLMLPVQGEVCRCMCTLKHCLLWPCLSLTVPIITGCQTCTYRRLPRPLCRSCRARPCAWPRAGRRTPAAELPSSRRPP